VNPTPKLNPPFGKTVCSGERLLYTPTSYTPGATFQWNRPLANHVNPATAFGSGGVSEILTNDQLTPVTTIYYYRLAIGSCQNLFPQAVVVTINPTPTQPVITAHPAGDLCSGTEFMNFGTTAPISGTGYHWTVTNGTIVATGANSQNILVSFNNPGPATVSVISNVNDFSSCTINGSYSFNVNGSTPSQHPQVIYFNHQFICLENDVDSYQWGYDDAHTLAATVLTGEVDQNYNNSNPDFNNKLYWCITRKSDCMQKSYYNLPTGITTVNTGGAGMRLYPNPANEVVNVEVNTSLTGNMQVQMINMMGQQLGSEKVINNKAAFMVGSLPSGAYLIECYREGVKVASSRFIKN